ncbi:HalOD1 output domain-containing protein [Haloarcula salina]|uniref:Halobacterial output domain-containing protein n=1 Tax=Haloarcula salina TaxID=1429914 RepID=A0AA41G9R0_9EURY|nr:HalOD1 output domain-containing protein [Haloarcula salina]MBV0902752.1 hypothetical protein [Haloarcula salina]
MSLEWNETQTVFWAEQHESPSEAIVSTIAAQQHVAETDLPPLYEQVDPEALDKIVASYTGSSIQISFTYSGYHVHIQNSDRIEISPN